MFRKKELFRKDLGGNRTQVSGNCIFTGNKYQCEVPTDGLDQYLEGVHAQVAMPSVSAEDREFLISGISPEGWNQKFGKL